jgi:glyoxylase-like metal-dependent hydrolase (beta-lactamase superfamily II)
MLVVDRLAVATWPVMPSPTDVPYSRGAHQIADGVWAYLQPDGGWGRSNAGLVASHDGASSLLVDTLFDLRLTDQMLSALREATPAAYRIATVVNTHANGDHCYGNALIAGADIVASEACAAEMAALPPATLAGLMRAAPDMGEAGVFLLDIFGDFDFDGIELVAPNRTFTGELELSVGDRAVPLIEVGPAHTDGDVIVHVPDAGVVFTGDILFHGSHPIVWAGPVANWIAACDRVLALEGVTTVVPGHGPVTTPETVARLKDYFGHLATQARARCDAGMSPLEAAADIDLGPYRDLRERERLVANVAALYREMGADVATDPASIVGLMAAARRQS